ncbi:chitobiosyldiphosphodolichol beta-mannosyltransferase-like protein [Dinothrombium tinctorium]|uniref:Chitobiosyldiphosphodolichol beta-mannosyltransferase n=1 Tax=Dinothrombium tinctorium TaxID=1965070 RepID=A0A3S3S0Y9_9ACAR|nr:chitobiosyldiphosphodolichol beta-mannosyltransferase-like protein [Dinothrombium tinctorium]
MSAEVRRVCVVVFGDVGRSPRMKYHSLAFAENGFLVDLIAYKGMRPHEKLLSNQNISLHLMENVPNFGKYLPKLLTYGLKTFWQSTVLLSLLLSLTKPQHIFVQNPPSIPCLPILWFYCYIRNIKFIVDWHNYGFTILALTLGSNHILVNFCRCIEGYFGSKADYHFCVSKALQNDLKKRWNINAIVLYDLPSDIFAPITLENKHEIFKKLMAYYTELKGSTSSETRFTREKDDGSIVEKEKRPALVITSTSWTEDEDFTLLIDALNKYDNLVADSSNKLPHLICIITGKGPLKEHYHKILLSQEWKFVEFLLPWLEPEDYPKVLASADLGICLHTSSSGLDLPMKVVDMFGCGLPVCAVDYSCLHELLQHDINGLAFKTSDDLCKQLKLLFEDFPSKDGKLKILKENLKKSFLNNSWNEYWRENALQIFTH